MSSTLVKNLTTVKLADGKWHIRGNTCESNVYPHTYSKWEGKVGWESREQLEGELIRDFYHGGLRGGSRYNDFVQELSNGVHSCRSWDRFVALDKMKGRVFVKSLEHINEPKDSPEKVRWGKVEQRLSLWMREVLLELGRDFRAWKPNTERFFVVTDDNHVVVGGGIRKCKVIRKDAGNEWKKMSKKFGKTAALRFASHYAKFGAKIERFVA